jgi:hypothetical protein
MNEIQSASNNTMFPDEKIIQPVTFFDNKHHTSEQLSVLPMEIMQSFNNHIVEDAPNVSELRHNHIAALDTNNKDISIMGVAQVIQNITWNTFFSMIDYNDLTNTFHVNAAAPIIGDINKTFYECFDLGGLQQIIRSASFPPTAIMIQLDEEKFKESVQEYCKFCKYVSEQITVFCLCSISYAVDRAASSITSDGLLGVAMQVSEKSSKSVNEIIYDLDGKLRLYFKPIIANMQPILLSNIENVIIDNLQMTHYTVFGDIFDFKNNGTLSDKTNRKF